MTILKTSKLYTIERYISQEEQKYPEATGEFTSLMHDLTFAFRLIAREVRRAGLNDILGLTDNINVHGEKVRKIDEWANEVILRMMDHSGHLCAMLTEEEENIVPIPEQYGRGKYVLAFDPLDGSSNLDVNITIGTIFSLLRRADPKSKDAGTEEDLLQPGYKQVAAGYILYGSSTQFVYTNGNGVNVFTYDPTIGQFLLTFENVTMPDYGDIYSVNEGYYYHWDKEIQQYLSFIKQPWGDRKKGFTSRYVAAIVADVHRLLHYGGLFMYPWEDDKPDGKIRLLYEANPLSMIVEQAGGRSIDGKNRIMEVQPTDIHQRVPIFIGSKGNIDEIELFLQGKHEFQREAPKA